MSTTTVQQPAYRQRLGYHAMVLGGICGLVATMIILGNGATHTTIAENLRQDQITLLSQVLPESLYDNDLLTDTKTITEQDQQHTVHIARVEGQAVAFALPIVGYGYSGAINMIMAADINGNILGVRVISHAETPGLGDKIELNKDDWITEFDGHSLTSKSTKQWAVKKDGGDFDQFTGATITPRAVVGAVYDGLILLNQHHDTLAAPADSSSVLQEE